ncbi:MAG: sigma-70 family RNA polymerase sigma factor [Actinomycetota bacterium]
MATRRLGQLRTSAASDRELVERVRDGDQAALAAIYDRYALRLTDLARAIVGPSGAEDVVHDAFVGAAQRIDQLRDPDKLRPWLYRITRRHALAHLRSRRTEPMGLEVTVGDPMVDGPLTEAERDELRRLVDDAAAGLEEKDRVLLHLLYRHELSPEEAGDVLDMRAEQVHARSFRVRDRFARSLGAVVVARHGRGNCVELRELLADWDGSITPRWRKRISRHLERCEVCSSTKDRVAAPMALLSVAPLVPVAAGMRERTLDAMSDALGFGAFTGDLDGDGTDGESSSNPSQNSPTSSQAQHPANQASSTSSSTSSTATSSTASSGAPTSVAGGSTSAGAGASSSSSAAAGSSSTAGSVSSTAGAGASSSSSAAGLTPTGPVTGWQSGTLAGAGSGSSASSGAAAASAKAGSTASAAVPPTPEIVDAPPPPPEIADPGIASTLLDTVKAAVGVGGAIAATTTVPAALPDTTVPAEPAGIVAEIDGDEIAVSPLEPIEIEAPATTESAPIIVIEPEVTEVPIEETTTTTVPESTTTPTTTTVPESTTTTTTTVPESTTTTTTTTEPESTTSTTEPEATTTTTEPATTSTTEDPLGGPSGAGDGDTGGADDEDGETGGAGEESTTSTSTTLP